AFFHPPLELRRQRARDRRPLIADWSQAITDQVPKLLNVVCVVPNPIGLGGDPVVPNGRVAVPEDDVALDHVVGDAAGAPA
ncbi:hypothetical protein, partial [Salmonella sp. SAL4432]|uniref:hypothetical protein n=1 Tax=Salmonella sp. SAL4432 TaxID=3159887 RepID=UPI00397D2A20